MYRFALSISKEFSFGDLCLFFINYLLSRKIDKNLSIYIYDFNTDKQSEENYNFFLRLLELLNIKDINIYHQSQNLKFYQQFATKLLMDKYAYNCFCEVQNRTKCLNRCKDLTDIEVLNCERPFSIRIDAEKKELNDSILLNIKKLPTIEFASTIDDMLNDISLVVDRKNINITNNSNYIRDVLGYKNKIKYIDIDLSKVDKLSVKELLEEGYLPQSILSLITSMIFERNTILEIENIIANFEKKDLEKLHFIFDKKELNKINRFFINRIEPLTLSTYIGYSSRDIGELAKLFTKNSDTITQIKSKIDIIFSKKEPKHYQKEFESIKKLVKDAPYFNDFDTFLEYLSKKSALDDKVLNEILNEIFELEDSKIEFKDIYKYLKNYLGEIIK